MEALQFGPVAVGIDGNASEFINYRSEMNPTDDNTKNKPKDEFPLIRAILGPYADSMNLSYTEALLRSTQLARATISSAIRPMLPIRASGYLAETGEGIECSVGIVTMITSEGNLILSDLSNCRKRVGISRINVPKLGRTPRTNLEGSMIPAIPQDPMGYACWAYLRNTLIGRQVYFLSEFILSQTEKEVGMLFRDDALKSNIANDLVCRGLATVKETRHSDWVTEQLKQAESEAKTKSLGQWNPTTIKQVTFKIADPNDIVQKYKGKYVNAMVDYVRDATNYRLVLIPSLEIIHITLSGVTIFPTVAALAKEFVEIRLMQRNVTLQVHVTVKGSSFQTVFGSIFLDNRTTDPECLESDGPSSQCDMALYLLLDGFATICQWNAKFVGDLQMYEKGLATAKRQKLGAWSSDIPDGQFFEAAEFHATVEFVSGGECIHVRDECGALRAVYLSSIRLPKTARHSRTSGFLALNMPLYLEAREILRKLVGQQVKIKVDFESEVYAGPNKGQQRSYCSLYYGGRNVAIDLVRNGHAKVIRYRQDDFKRSQVYNELLEAESAAEASKLGIHGKHSVSREIRELRGEVAQSYIHQLRQAKRIDCVVEWVINGSRLKLYAPSKQIVFTLALQGISCPKGSTANQSAEPFGDEVTEFVKGLCLQRDVKVSISHCDKSGCFFGKLFIDSNRPVDELIGGQNLSLILLAKGLARIHEPSARRMDDCEDMIKATEKAIEEKSGLWSVETAAETEEPDEIEVKDITDEQYDAFISHAIILDRDIVVYVRRSKDIEKFEPILSQLNGWSPDVGPHQEFKPSIGQIVAYRKDEGCCRATVRSLVGGAEKVELLLLDFGEIVKDVDVKLLRKIPSEIASLISPIRPMAVPVKLAFLEPNLCDEECVFELVELLSCRVDEVRVETIYRKQSIDYVSIQSGNVDLTEEAIKLGLLIVKQHHAIPSRQRGSPLVEKYIQAEEFAKSKRQGIWRYGDLIYDEISFINDR
ncbi:hypothetical protein ACOME3_004791 [Neoechinorhynchus agilis]